VPLLRGASRQGPARPARHSRAHRQRHPHVLARHDPMGAIRHALRFARRLHFQPARFSQQLSNPF